MLELYIDSELVVLDNDICITLIKENPSITNSGSYTYDIDIPLTGNTSNSAIFGNIDRVEVGYTNRTYSAKIVFNNSTIIDGTAAIISSSNTSVSIQILEGNAESNFTNTLNNLYINEFDIEVVDENTLKNISLFSQWSYSELIKVMYGTYEYNSKNFVLYPIQSSSGDTIRNDFKIKTTYVNNYSIEVSDNIEDNSSNLAPQPYLCFVIESIFEASGYSLIYNYLLETPLKNLFVANVKPTHLLSEMLPEWTVQELFIYIEQFAGVVFITNEKNKTVSIIKRNEAILNNRTYIYNLASEIEKEVEDDDFSDISIANIGYDQDFSDNYLSVDSAIIANTEKKTGYTIESAVAYLMTLDDDERQNYLFIIDGAQYVYDTDNESIKEINQFQPLIQRDSDEIDIELQIVPVDLVEGTFTNDHYEDDRAATPTKKYFSLTLMETSESDEVISNPFNIIEAIEGEAEFENSYPDKIEVAFNDGSWSTLTNTANYFSAQLPHTLYSDPFDATSFRNYSLELNPISGRTTLYNIAYEAAYTVEKRIAYTIYFESDVILNPSQTFVIHNKLYACESLEYTLTSTGMEKLVKGVFYMIEQN